MPYYISPPPQNPLLRLVTAIIAVFALAGAFMIGIAAFLVIAGVGLVAGLVIWLRVAWIKRKLGKNGVNLEGTRVSDRARGTSSGQVIDAEYTVISEEEGEN